MQRIFLVFVRLYKTYLSPATPSVCRFYPTCSEYAYLSIQRHGWCKGTIKALARILRCHPFNLGGYDPVK